MIPRPALAVVSAAILAYEVLLVRLFSIVQWHHFAFMAISVALLGFGISGALIAILRPWAAPRAGALFSLAAAGFGLSAPPAFLLAQALPFNALAVIWEPSQLLWLGAIYLVLAVPFTVGAACIGLAFVAAGASPGRIYLWNLLGSGAGALGVVGLLLLLHPVSCLAATGALGLAAAALAEAGRGARRDAGAVVAVSALAALAWVQAPASWTAPRISEFKGLPQALAVGQARIAAERSGPLALVSVVESPAVPFRYAPGLSLQSPALPPPQLGLFADGAFEGAIDLWDGDLESLAYLDHTTDALVYHLVRAPQVLVLGAGGGRDVLQAIGHGAARIDAVERNPDLLSLVAEDFAARAGHPYARPEVATHAADARRFLAAAPGDWDVITLPLSPASGGAGQAQGLGEDFLHTAEALGLAHRRLAPGGWLRATAPVDLPPRTALKLVSTLREALAGRGIARPGDQLLAIRGMSTVTILARSGPVTAADIAVTRDFVRARGLDLVHYPGMTAAEANLRNRLSDPAFFEGMASLLGPEPGRFTARYLFDIAAATDDRPYFHDFFRWAALPHLLALGPVGGAALLELGELIIVATLLQALILGLVLVLLPLRAGRYRSKSRPLAWRFGLYFTALGLAFLFVEMAWIQKFVLFLGDPVFAVAVALAGFLVFAGLGAGVSARLDRALAGSRISAIGVAVAGIALIALGYLAALPWLLDRLAWLGEPARIAVALALIAPLAFCMGMPFPLGLARAQAADPDLVPWAWGLNGCASVLSAAAATLIMMQAGFAAAVIAAVGLYLAAALMLRR